MDKRFILSAIKKLKKEKEALEKTGGCGRAIREINRTIKYYENQNKENEN